MKVKGNPVCDLCPLSSGANSICQMGAGKASADIMVILDNPGYSEDMEGEPIAGRSKTFLRGLLKDAGIDLSRVYFTNAIKCAPPQGYKVKVSEIKACSIYLEQEIKKVKPRHILTMGATALKATIGKGAITQVHGNTQEIKGITYMPVFAPGIAFRDPRRLEQLKADLHRFAKVASGKSIEVPELHPIIVKGFETFNEMIAELRTTRVASFDIETNQLSRFGGTINILGIGTPHNQYLLPLNEEWLSKEFGRIPNIQRELVEMISEALDGIRVVTHNGKFDNLWLRHHYGVRIHNSFDTMIAAYILDENTPNGLNYLARTKLGVPDWDIGLDVKKGEGSLEELCKYAAYDLYYTLELYYYFKRELRRDPAIQTLFQKLLMPIFHVYEDVQDEGVYINQEQFAVVEEVLTKNLKDVDKKLNAMTEEVIGKTINWRSPQQVAKWLFEDLGLPIIETTATGNPGTGESVLLRLVDKHESVKLLLERRGIQQQISFFIDGWKKQMYKGKIYPNFNIHVTVTGRTSSNEPNLQQVPRDPRIRSLIGAPPGWTLVEVDYSQVELRVIGELARDPRMQEVFMNNLDIHGNTAKSLSGREDYTKDMRENAKAVNFGFVYGMGHRKFREYARDNYGLHITEREALEWRTRFFEEYSQLPKWHDKQRLLVNKFGRVRNLVGRLRRLPEINSPDGGLRSEAERQAINSPVQSFASDVMLMSLVEIREELPWDKVRIIGSVHDAGLYIIKNEYLNEYIPRIKEIMEDPRILKELGVSLTVPLTVDVDIGSWGKGQEWNGEHIEVDDDGVVTLIKQDEQPKKKPAKRKLTSSRKKRRRRLKNGKRKSRNS